MEPMTAAATPRHTPPRRVNISPMMRLARPMTTTPVPRLMLLDIWYWASTPPERAVQPLAMHRPTVMVKAGSMEEAETMSRLSPVARMDRPIWVLRKRAMAAAAAMVMAAQRMSLLHSLPSRAAARVNTVSALSRGRSARLPMVHRLMV